MICFAWMLMVDRGKMQSKHHFSNDSPMHAGSKLLLSIEVKKQIFNLVLIQTKTTTSALSIALLQCVN